MAKGFCTTCGENIEADLSIVNTEVEIHKVKVSYDRTIATCPLCGKEVYIPKINDKNAKAREEAYKNQINH